MKRDIKTPLLAVDAVILFQGGIVLIRRANPPHQGCYALPGGFVEIGETVEEAMKREAREETGLDIDLPGIGGHLLRSRPRSEGACGLCRLSCPG